MSKAKELNVKYKTLLNTYEINTPLRRAMFFAQLDHESNLKPISENLNYSKEGLLRTFKKYFNETTAASYAGKPKEIANRVYANRNGNGSEASGDGYKFRGRGFIQLTGKSNYKALSDKTKTDYVNNPELLLTEADALISALWFWQKNSLNLLADKEDVKGATKVINGGINGLADRELKFKAYKKEFAV